MLRPLWYLLLAAISFSPVLKAQAEESIPSAHRVSHGGIALKNPAAPVSVPIPARKPSRLPLPVDPHVDAYAKLGSDRRLAGTEAFVPLGWNGQLLTFADLRFVGDDADGRELNAGLGARRVSDDGLYIFGAYGFVDRRRSGTGHLYTQATAGAEILTEDWEGRVNAYAPLTGTKTLSRILLPTALSLSGTGIVATGGSATARETPLYGADIEVGRKLGFLKNTAFADTWAYAGAYRFDAPGVEAMNGGRVRLETGPFEWLRFGVEAQHDNIRGETGFVEARIRVPLDFWRGVKHGPARPKGIYSRLNARIARDVDIVTQSQQERTQAQAAPVLNAATGAAQKVYVVDNTASGGDGSAEHPFATLAAAEGAAGAHDIIYVKRGDGTSAGMNGGVVLDDAGQRLIGSGVALAFDSGTMRLPDGVEGIADGAAIVSAGSAPVVTNAAGDGIAITADSIEVAGLTVNGAADNGIYVYNAEDITIRDVTLSGNVNDGIRVEASGAGTAVTGVSIEGATASGNRNGIRLYAQSDASLAARVESSTMTGNSDHGLVVYDDSTLGSVDADLGGGSQGSAGLNILTGNTREDLSVDADGAALSAQNNWWGQAGGPSATDLYFGAPLDDGLVMHWTFDDGTARDRSGMGYDGTLLNAPTPSSGALDFNNPGDSESVQGVDVNESDTGAALSVFLRLRPDALIATQTVISKWEPANSGAQNSWGIRALNGDGANFFAFIAAGGDSGNNYFATSNAALAAGSWARIGFVYDGSGAGNAARLKVYKGATQLAGAFTGTIPAALNPTNEPVRVAFPLINNPAFAQPFDGLIDDVRVYNRALSAAEVSELDRSDTASTVTTTGALSAAP